MVVFLRAPRQANQPSLARRALPGSHCKKPADAGASRHGATSVARPPNPPGGPRDSLLMESGAVSGLRSGDFERLDPGEFAAFEPFEEGAAGGRDIAELVHDPGHRERRHGVAAAGDA